jgi:hypothetical protein
MKRTFGRGCGVRGLTASPEGGDDQRDDAGAPPSDARRVHDCRRSAQAAIVPPRIARR